MMKPEWRPLRLYHHSTRRKKEFYCGGPLNWARSYFIDRSNTVNEIVAELSSDSYILLHAHRQAGKSSLLSLIIHGLTQHENNVLPICVSLEGVKEANFWPSLYSRMKAVYEPIQQFASGEDFLDVFRSANFDGKVMLLLDELDVILNYDAKWRTDILRILRTVQTTNAISKVSPPYAISAVLGIGVFHITRLTGVNDDIDTAASPFNVSLCVRLRQGSFEEVHAMLNEYGNDIGVDIYHYAADIYGRTQGHAGLTSLLCKLFHEWIQRTGIENITIGRWVAYVCGAAVFGEIVTSSVFKCIEASLMRERNGVELSTVLAITRSLLSADYLADAYNDNHRKAVDYMETEGVIVREMVNNEPIIRFAAPLLRLALYSRFADTMRSLPAGTTLAFKSPTTCDLDMLRCLFQGIQYFDRKSLFHETSLKKNRTPFEFAYHFQLYGILQQMAHCINWRVTCEARNATIGSQKRLDIFVANNGSRYGYELVADATERDLKAHYEDQSIQYKSALKLAKIVIVNFISVIPDKKPNWWFIASDADVSIVHAHIPKPDKAAPIEVYHYDGNEIKRDIIDFRKSADPLSETLSNLSITTAYATADVGTKSHVNDDILALESQVWEMLHGDACGNKDSMKALLDKLGIFKANQLRDCDNDDSEEIKSLLKKVSKVTFNRLMTELKRLMV